MLTVGSDCAIGKMTVALELDAEARRRGIASEFVPTGQTGIAIAGWGISVDAVVADFIAGASEQLVLEGIERGGELLWVEGQGSLLHPAYSGVTLGLLHGSAPHALVLCHQAGQRFVDDDERFPIPPLAELVELHERVVAPRAAGEGASRSRSTRAISTTPRRAPRSRRPRRRLVFPRTTRYASAAARGSRKPFSTGSGCTSRNPTTLLGAHHMRKLVAALVFLAVVVPCSASANADRRHQRRRQVRGDRAHVLHADDAGGRTEDERAHDALGRHAADSTSTPTSQSYLGSVITAAQSAGVTVELDLYPLHSQAFTGGKKCAPSTNPLSCGDSTKIAQFAAWVGDGRARPSRPCTSSSS